MRRRRWNGCSHRVRRGRASLRYPKDDRSHLHSLTRHTTILAFNEQTLDSEWNTIEIPLLVEWHDGIVHSYHYSFRFSSLSMLLSFRPPMPLVTLSHVDAFFSYFPSPATSSWGIRFRTWMWFWIFGSLFLSLSGSRTARMQSGNLVWLSYTV